MSRIRTVVPAVAIAAGAPLGLHARTGSAPLWVNSSTNVTRLNADYVDGLNASSLQTRTTRYEIAPLATAQHEAGSVCRDCGPGSTR